MNLISSFYDLKLYGGATISNDRLICDASGRYGSIRIQADPLSEINVRCLAKATGTPDKAGVFIAYPSTSVIVTSLKAELNDWQELELNYTVPASNNTGYVEIVFGSKTTGTCWIAKPVIEVKKSSRFAGGLMAGGIVAVSGGEATLVTSVSRFGIESVAINPSNVWIDVTLAADFTSSLLPIVSITPEINGTTNYARIAAGNFGGTGQKTLRVYVLDSSGAAINLSTASVRFFITVNGF